MTKPDREAALSALKANGGAIRQTARQIGIPPSTLSRWAAEAGLTGTDGTLKKLPTDEQLAAELRRVAAMLLDQMTQPEKLKRASLKDVAIAFGVAIDKMERLLDRMDVAGAVDGDLAGLLVALKESRGDD